jgi:hypothetical protein
MRSSQALASTGDNAYLGDSGGTLQALLSAVVACCIKRSGNVDRRIRVRAPDREHKPLMGTEGRGLKLTCHLQPV